jgi:hypothetical protein
MTAGADLRAALDTALAREARAQGRSSLQFDEREQQHVEAAIAAADAAELLEGRIATLAADPTSDPGTLVRLLAEARQQRGKVVELLRWLDLPVAWSATADPQRTTAGKGTARVARLRGRPGSAV